MKKDIEVLNSFLNSYHSMMDYLRMIASYPSEFNIFITKYKKDTNNQILRISIIRTVKEDLDQSGHYLDIPTVLPNEMIISAINGIRDDFKDNHEIMYAGISGDYNYQFLQNTNFKLSITIGNNEELEEAKRYNQEINSNPNRFNDKNKALMLVKKEK